MNNYLKVLSHLKQYEGDEEFHDIETVIHEIDLETKRKIFRELKNEGLIKLTGGRAPVYSFGKSLRNNYGDASMRWKNLKIGEDTEYKGKITFKGAKYLKEELLVINADKYNIQIGENTTANVIFHSANASIHNQVQTDDKEK